MRVKNPFLHVEGNSCVVRCCTLPPYMPDDEVDGGLRERGLRFRVITLMRKFLRSCRKRSNKIEDEEKHESETDHPKESMPC